MLLGIIGNPRTGKTLLCTKFTIRQIKMAESQHKKMYWFANYHYKEQYTKIVKFIEPKDFLTIQLDDLNSGNVDLDELWTWVLSRGSGYNKNNALLGMIAFQSGKLGFDIKWTSQLSSAVDKWFRLMTDYFYVALKPAENYFRYAYVSSTKIIKFKYAKIKAKEEVYPYFNTQERVLPIQGSLNKPYIPESIPKSDYTPDENLIKETKDTVEQQLDIGVINTLKRQIKREVIEQLREDLGIHKEVPEEVWGKKIIPIEI